MEKLMQIISQILKMISENRFDPHEDQDQLIDHLVREGYEPGTVQAAMQFFFSSHGFLPGFRKRRDSAVLRIFHPRETSNLTVDSQGLLFDVYINGYISSSDLEEIMIILSEIPETVETADVMDILENAMGCREGHLDTSTPSFYLN